MTESGYIVDVFGRAGIKLSADKAEKLAALAEYMVEYNRNVNLTAITDFKEIAEKHFLDSILPLSLIHI